jgi:hypothetical protein
MQMENYVKHNWLIRITLLLILVAVSCTPGYSSDAFLAEVLDPQDCELPCWHGIVPRQSSQEDLLQVLEQLPDSKVEKIQEEDIPDYGVKIWWEDNNIGSTYNAFFQENELIYIESQPALDITLEELVATMGPPDQYIATLGAGEVYILYVQLFYEELGIQVTLWTTSPEETLIKELESCESPIPLETAIQRLRIMPPQTAESMINAISKLQFNYTVDQFRPWSDEGIYLSNCAE